MRLTLSEWDPNTIITFEEQMRRILFHKCQIVASSYQSLSFTFEDGELIIAPKDAEEILKQAGFWKEPPSGPVDNDYSNLQRKHEEANHFEVIG